MSSATQSQPRTHAPRAAPPTPSSLSSLHLKGLGQRIVALDHRRTNSEYDKLPSWLPTACTVVVHDLIDTAHQLDVTAETLYEAVAQALAIARGHDWVGDIGTRLTTITAKVRNPEITHIVRIQDFENWLNGACKSPADMVLKTRLRHMLGMDKP